MQKPIKEKIQQAVRVDRAIQLVWQAAPGWTMINLVLQIIQGILPPGSSLSHEINCRWGNAFSQRYRQS